MATIDDLETLGYTTVVANGSVEVEEEALALARAEATPAAVAEHANTVTNETIQQLDALGKLPDTPEGRLELAQRIAMAAIEQLTTATSEKVAFHERALAIARTLPNVWRVNQAVTVDDQEINVVQAYVRAKDDGTGWEPVDQEVIDALADPAGFAERAFQVTHADAFAAAAALHNAGKVVERDPGTDTFVVDGKAKTTATIVVLAEEVAAEPPLPTTAEKVATVLTTAPELGEQTRAALIHALAPPHT